uniref:Nance-Horan syndrome protein n=1 Tax=Oncorhynchus mykiss TaxID=8022 RepID=A0A8C7RUA7_ONCMY
MFTELHGAFHLIGFTQIIRNPALPKHHPFSYLDVECKLSDHYVSPWLLQRNVFLPPTRPPCLQELHRTAQQGLRASHRGTRTRRKVTIAVSVAPPMPTYPSPHSARRRPQRGWSLTAAPPSDSLGQRPRHPVPNVPSTLDKQTNWSRVLPLPTPQERMKSDSQVITSCVIPINVTGVQFHRDSSVHCSLIHSQSVLQRRRKLRRRKTVIGIPRSVQQDLDSDESTGARERTVVVRCNAALCSEDLCSRLNTKKDSGCQTEDFLVCAPSHWRVQYQRGQQGVSSALVPLSLSTGNISSLLDTSEHNNAMFSSLLGVRLRSRSQPREGRRLIEVHHHSEEEEEEELSPSETDDFLYGLGELKEKGGGGADDQSQPDHPLASLKYQQRTGSPWLERGQSRLPRKVDMGSCEMSSSSDTFSSPLHSTSTRRVVGCQMDHKDDHQSSSGNWSGSSSTCPSHTSETLPPAASPRLTGSSHCDSELSLNTGPHATDDPAPILILDPYQTDRQLDDAGVSMASDGEWSYPHPDSRLHDFSPERSREGEGSLGYPSFTSMATCESFITDKPPSEKADTVSYYSIDNEGYYTSMHFDCGLKGSKSLMYNYSDCGQEHMTLGRRCLTLRKPKAKPSAPRRSSSLRKISGGGDSPDDTEPKNRSGQQRKSCSRERRLQLDLEGSLGHPNLPDPHPEMPGSGLFGSSDRGSYKDEGAVQSDYADLWLVNDLKSNTDPYRSLSNSSTATGTTVIECIKSQESSESQTSQSGSTPSLPSVEDFKMSSLPSVEGDFKMSSPERLAGLVSPSSGYSSQSETPTSSFPCAFFPSPLSPTNQKRKPKIPERKSSLSITSTRDLELPVIPPSHQNLSALYSPNPTSPPPVSTKPPGHRNQLYLLQQSKQTAAASARAEARVATETSSSLPMTITPTVLHSVQLRSVGKQGEGSPARPGPDVATRPKCPTVNISPPSSSRSPESTTRNPPKSVQKSVQTLSYIQDCEVPLNQSSFVLYINPAQPCFPDSRPSDNSIFSLSEETKAEGDVFLSSTKACTTEELFAMIHRSRRKVLGRKDSGELSARSSLCAPVTPPGNTMTSLVNPSTPTTPTGSQKAPGPIYRSLKKSSTSHEEFKLLLLKKGSRSDSSYRMSATEILKSPISPNAPGDPLAEKPLSPPPGTEKLPSPFTEGFSPKGLSTAACPRQSRSRIPPPPTSSRYSIRSRQHPAPMQAISEGETENSDRSPS